MTARPTTNRWIVLVVVCLAQFMVVLDVTIVNVALPSIQRALHFSATGLQWVVNGYTLVFAGCLLLGGRAADLLGRRRLFVLGVLLFSIASLVNALAQSSGVLIAGRALQGLGAALVSPAALAIITTTFPEPAERTKALGVWSAIAAGGAAFGLLLGGILTDTLSWAWIFLVNVPVGVVAVLAALRWVPESRAGLTHRIFDLAGAAAVTGGLMLLVYTIVKAQQYGWGASETLLLGATSLVILAGFVVIEQRSRHPLVRLSIFRVRSLTSADLILMLLGAGMYSMFYFASLYTQDILGYDPLKAGFAFLPVSVGIIVGAVAAQQLIGRVGVRAVGTVGLVIATAGMFLLTGITPAGTYLGSLLIGLGPLSIGIGLTFVPITLLATANVSDEDAGLASGLYNTSQQIGGALGLAILSTLAADKTTSALMVLGRAPAATDRAAATVDGFQVAFIGGAIALGLAAILMRSLIRPSDVDSIDPAAPLPVPG